MSIIARGAPLSFLSGARWRFLSQCSPNRKGECRVASACLGDAECGQRTGGKSGERLLAAEEDDGLTDPARCSTMTVGALHLDDLDAADVLLQDPYELPRIPLHYHFAMRGY